MTDARLSKLGSSHEVTANEYNGLRNSRFRPEDIEPDMILGGYFHEDNDYTFADILVVSVSRKLRRLCTVEYVFRHMQDGITHDSDKIDGQGIVMPHHTVDYSLHEGFFHLPKFAGPEIDLVVALPEINHDVLELTGV